MVQKYQKTYLCRRMKHVLSLLLLIFSLFSPLQAEEIGEAQANRLALRYFAALPRAASAGSAAPSVELLRRTPAAYLFRRGTDCLLLARDTEDPALLGYFTATRADSLPAPLAAMLRQPRRAAYPPVGAAWQPVAPLLTTVRHQSAPYNRCCPRTLRPDGTLSPEPCLVGCVATAMEQILTYHRCVYTLRDTLHGWETERYTIADVLPGESIDARLILDNYDGIEAPEAAVDAVARLSYYLGVACRMNWGESSSGANSVRLAEPLRRAFGLPYVHYLDSYQYHPTAYWNYLAAEIAAGRPVYYAGSIMRTGGHAFVLDGLDADGLFHVNWGYGGEFDGYFRLDVLAYEQPESDRREDFVESGFFCNQEAIAVSPFEVPGVLPPDTLARTGREVEVRGLWLDDEPLTGCYSRVRLILHNTADSALTTPFALVQSAPADTARLAQGKWLALTGRTLGPHETDTLCVHVQFSAEGRQLLCLTPDGEQILDSLWVEVRRGGTLDIEADRPEVDFPKPLTARCLVPLRNADGTERAAQFFEYDLLHEASGTSARLTHFIYLPPAGGTTDTVCFSQLLPGERYTLRVRRRWPVVQEVSFEVPVPEGIGAVGAESGGGDERWFTPEGRRLARPTSAGLYLRRRGGRVEKVVLHR